MPFDFSIRGSGIGRMRKDSHRFANVHMPMARLDRDAHRRWNLLLSTAADYTERQRGKKQ
jgi:hypothetical protein